MLLARKGYKVLVVRVAYGPWHTVLDEILVDAAIEAGGGEGG